MQLSDSDDSELLKKMARGNRKAFEIIYCRYSEYVLCFLRKTAKDEDLARDATQDIFLKLWMNRESLTNVTHLRTYLSTMGKNRAGRLIRRNILKNKVSKVFLDELARTSESIENGKDLEAKIREVSRVMNFLTHRQREVMKMSFLQGLSFDTIAQQLGLSGDTVRTHIRDGKKLIRDLHKHH